MRTALMSRITDCTIVKDFGSNIETPKTKEILEGLSRLGIPSQSKVLIILSNPSDVIKRSIRNLERVKLIAADQLNVFDLLNAKSIVLGEAALLTIKEVYGND